MDPRMWTFKIWKTLTVMAAVLAVGVSSASAAPLVLPVFRYWGTPYVEATVNGVRGLLCIDTGSSSVHIQRDIVAKLGLVSIGSRSVSTFTGVRKEDEVILNDLEIGGRHYTTHFACVIPEDSTPLRNGKRIIGLIGMDILGRQPFSIDFRNSTLTLHEPDSFIPPAVASQVIRADRSTPRVEASIEGRRGWFEVDTGFSDTVLLSRAFAELNEDLILGRAHIHTGTVWGEKSDSMNARWGSSVIFGEQQTEVNGAYDTGDRLGTRTSGLIGTAYLRERILTIDWAARKLWVEKPPPEALDLLLERLRDKSKRDLAGSPALSAAVALKRPDAIKALLKLGELVDDTDDRMISPLMIAAARDEVEAIDLLLSHGAKVNAHCKADGYSALLFAARFGRLAAARRLIDAGADVNQTCDSGATPLFRAAEGGRVDVAGLLLEHGAKVDAPQVTGETPLLAASANQDAAMVKLLLEHKADANASAGRFTCLSYAAFGGAPDCVKLLLAYGGDPSKYGPRGTVPLVAAASVGMPGATECVRLLLAAGADPTTKVSTEDTAHAGKTALDFAIEQGNPGSILLLMPPSRLKAATQPANR